MTTATLSPAYLAALEASNVAIRKYNAVRDAYRARTVGDAEFLAAREAYMLAQEAFDAAFAAEEARAAEGCAS